MSSDEIRYNELIGDLKAYKNASFQALSDAHDARNGDNLIYCVDFNIIHSYMWEELKSHGEGNDYRSAFFDSVGRTIMKLKPIYPTQSEFVIAISDLTLVEIVESIYHRYKHFSAKVQNSTSANDLFSNLNRMFDDLNKEIKIDSKQALQIIRKINAQLPNGSIKDATNRISHLIEAKTVRFLSDIVPRDTLAEAVKYVKPMQSEILGRIRRDRHGRENRSFYHSMLHYGADAWNLIIPEGISKTSNNTLAKFVCKPELRRYLLEDHQRYLYTRSPLVPFLKLVSLYGAGHRSDLFREADDWLAEVYDQARLRVERLQKVSSITDLTENSLLYIDRFYNDYVRKSIAYEDDKKEMDIERDRISSIIKRKSSLLEHFEAAETDAKKGGQQIIKARPEIRSKDLLEDYDLADNPHLQEVYRKLGLDC